MDIYERLTQDHDRHRGLTKRVLDTSGGATEERASLWQELRSELLAHAAAEEQTFYASLIELDDGQEKARHSIAEHKEFADTIEEIDALDMSSPQWLRKCRDLADEVEHHMVEEEKEVFVVAREILPDGEAQRLAGAFDEAKAARIDEFEAAAADSR